MKLKKIVVKNNLAFACCQLAQSKDGTRKYLTGVCIMPNGRVAGTNGHFLTYCDDVIEPFEGDPIIISAKALSITQSNSGTIEISIDGKMEATITWRADNRTGNVKDTRQLIPANIIDAKFPETDGIIKEAWKGKAMDGIAFNSTYPAETAKRINKWTADTAMTFNGDLNPIGVDFCQSYGKGIKMVLMPIRV